MKKFLSSYDTLHTADKETFYDKDGEEIQSVISRVADLNTFAQEVAKERGMKNPKLVPGMDGSVDKCLGTGIVMEPNEVEEEDCLHKYKVI